MSEKIMTAINTLTAQAKSYESELFNLPQKAEALYDACNYLKSLLIEDGRDIEEAAKKYANMHADVSDKLGQHLVKGCFIDGANYVLENSSCPPITTQKLNELNKER